MIQKNMSVNLCRIAIIFCFVSFNYAQPETKNDLSNETRTSVKRIISPKVGLKEDGLLIAEDKVSEIKTDWKRSFLNQIPVKGSFTDNFKPNNFNSLDKTKAGGKKIDTDERQTENRGSWRLPTGAVEYGIDIGFAPNIATFMSGSKYYDIRGHKHFLGSVRYGRILGNKGIVTVSYALEITPFNLAIGNEVDNENYQPGNGQSPTKRETTFGVGINPANFRFIFFPGLRLRPQIGAGFGVVRHLSRIPTIDGTKGNAQVNIDLGGQYMLTERRALNFGYRYYHLSNVYLARRNPGYNVNMFFVGISIFKK